MWLWLWALGAPFTLGWGGLPMEVTVWKPSCPSLCQPPLPWNKGARTLPEMKLYEKYCVPAITEFFWKESWEYCYYQKRSSIKTKTEIRGCLGWFPELWNSARPKLLVLHCTLGAHCRRDGSCSVVLLCDQACARCLLGSSGEYSFNWLFEP